MMSIVRYVTTLVAHPLNFPQMMNWMNEYGKKEYKKDRSFYHGWGRMGLDGMEPGEGKLSADIREGILARKERQEHKTKKTGVFTTDGAGWDWMGGNRNFEFRVLGVE